MGPVGIDNCTLCRGDDSCQICLSSNGKFIANRWSRRERERERDWKSSVCLPAKRTLPSGHYSAQILNDKNLTISPSSIGLFSASQWIDFSAWPVRLFIHSKHFVHSFAKIPPRIRANAILPFIRFHCVYAVWALKVFQDPNHIEWLSSWHYSKLDQTKRFT